MFKTKRNRFVALELNEYVIRVIVMNNQDVNQAVVYEQPLSPGIIEGDSIRDEMALFDEFKKMVEVWGIKRHDVRFFVQDSSVMMKTFEHPSDVVAGKLKAYVEMELGQTIHLPFTNPLIDVYDAKLNDGEATLFAAPSEEVNKMASLLDDVSLTPTVADVRSLSTIRLLEKLNLFTPQKSYLITDWSISGLSISIYTPGKLEFLRYQAIETSMKSWESRVVNEHEVTFTYDGEIEEYRMLLIDQIAEIDRILNFYRFSLYKGEKAVDEIIILGDSPEMDYIVNEMRATYETPIQFIDDSKVQTVYPNLNAKYIPLIGLVLKEAL
ncbi:type IV pilus assembly protein PilM [Psychrobacillus sp. OK028]|uniref:type IV pilus biogenesis protein PilM n=1 Tax=Psychrobacillus sp. OK028 TaxID=1884359 RepID=UPI0008891A8D|nr:pilus assembly protein PilM [Psychrobacillus sp. OK028]SDM80072.1 type IV pilus assembly protein PilM [Psychrobacillus sp. OK028]